MVTSTNSSSLDYKLDQFLVVTEDNIQYRYYTLGICFAHTLLIIINTVLVRPRLSSICKRKSIWWRTFKSLIDPPLWIQVSIWIIIAVLINVIPLTSTSRTELDWVIFWKRTGTVGYSLTPFILLLSLRPNPLPQVLYANLLPLHKWLGRIYICLICIHSVYFIQQWGRSSRFSELFWKVNPITGFISFVIWLIFALVSLRPFRTRLYKVFYCLHMIAIWTTVPLIGIHSRPRTHFINVVNLVLMIYMGFSKIYYYAVINKRLEFLNIERHINSQLIVLTLPKSYYRGKQLRFNPGSHVRINHRFINPLSWISPSHPYTIASLDTDQEIKLIIKETKFKIHSLGRYSVSSPFSNETGTIHGYDNITIICGGSGIAFGLPFYRMNNPDCFVHLVWLVRCIEDLHVLVNMGVLDVDELGAYSIRSENFSGKLDIYITFNEESFEPVQEIQQADVGVSSILSFNELFEWNDGDYTEMKEDDVVELQEMGISTMDTSCCFIHHEGRPSLKAIVDEDFQTGTCTNCLVACGPSRLVKECSNLARLYDSEFISETYNF